MPLFLSRDREGTDSSPSSPLAADEQRTRENKFPHFIGPVRPHTAGRKTMQATRSKKKSASWMFSHTRAAELAGSEKAKEKKSPSLRDNPRGHVKWISFGWHGISVGHGTQESRLGGTMTAHDDLHVRRRRPFSRAGPFGVFFSCRWSPRPEQPRPQAAPLRLLDELSSGSLLSCSLVLDLENRSRLRIHDFDVWELWIELVRGGTTKGSSSSMITLQLSKSRGRWWSRRGSSGYLCVSLSPAETLYK